MHQCKNTENLIKIKISQTLPLVPNFQKSSTVEGNFVPQFSHCFHIISLPTFPVCLTFPRLLNIRHGPFPLISPTLYNHSHPLFAVVSRLCLLLFPPHIESSENWDIFYRSHIILLLQFYPGPVFKLFLSLFSIFLSPFYPAQTALQWYTPCVAIYGFGFVLPCVFV